MGLNFGAVWGCPKCIFTTSPRLSTVASGVFCSEFGFRSRDVSKQAPRNGEQPEPLKRAAAAQHSKCESAPILRFLSPKGANLPIKRHLAWAFEAETSSNGCLDPLGHVHLYCILGILKFRVPAMVDDSDMFVQRRCLRQDVACFHEGPRAVGKGPLPPKDDNQERRQTTLQ